MHINFNLTLRWLADTQQWRVHTEDGTYWTAATIDQIPVAVRGLLRVCAAEIRAFRQGATKIISDTVIFPIYNAPNPRHNALTKDGGIHEHHQAEPQQARYLSDFFEREARAT